MTESISRFCRSCNYDLNGLSEHRCPECGREFDPENPKSFANTPDWHFRRKLKFVGICSVVLAVLYVVGSGIEHGYARFSCENCGARSNAKYFSFYEWGGLYSRVTDEGPVSKFIQAYEGAPCNHKWEMSTDSFGRLLSRAYGLGRGFKRYNLTSLIDHFGESDNIALLNDAKKYDSKFALDLIDCVRNPNDGQKNSVLEYLSLVYMDLNVLPEMQGK